MITANINITKAFNHCQTISNILNNSFNSSEVNKTAVKLNSTKEIKKKNLNKKNGDSSLGSKLVAPDVIESEEAIETPSNCIISDYIAQVPTLNKYKLVIKNFLLKYIVLPVDDGLATRTIKLFEAQQANSLLSTDNLHSKWGHVCQFFVFVGRKDLVTDLEEWKNKAKQIERSLLYEEDDCFKTAYDSLRQQFIRKPTRCRAELLNIAIMIYCFP